MDTIVVATDGAPASQEAVRVSLELAQEHGAELAFVHVRPPDRWKVVPRGPLRAVTYRIPREEPDGPLDEAAEEALDAGVAYTLVRFRGDTVEAVLRTAEETDADLIVVGTRGRGPIAAALLGSVSRELLRRSRRSVLVARADDGERRVGLPLAA